MITVNIHEAKTHLSHYLEAASKGERIIVCRRNRPIAELRPFSGGNDQTRRPFGLAQGVFATPDSFFDELPAPVIAGFAGQES